MMDWYDIMRNVRERKLAKRDNRAILDIIATNITLYEWLLTQIDDNGINIDEFKIKTKLSDSQLDKFIGYGISYHDINIIKGKIMRVNKCQKKV